MPCKMLKFSVLQFPVVVNLPINLHAPLPERVARSDPIESRGYNQRRNFRRGDSSSGAGPPRGSMKRDTASRPFIQELPKKKTNNILIRKMNARI